MDCARQFSEKTGHCCYNKLSPSPKNKDLVQCQREGHISSHLLAQIKYLKIWFYEINNILTYYPSTGYYKKKKWCQMELSHLK